MTQQPGPDQPQTYAPGTVPPAPGVAEGADRPASGPGPQPPASPWQDGGAAAQPPASPWQEGVAAAQPPAGSGQPGSAAGPWQPAQPSGVPAPVSAAAGPWQPAQPSGVPAPPYPQGAGWTPPGVPYAQAAVPPPPPEARWRPARVDALPGTGFALVQLEVAPAASGMATGSLVAGIASIGVSVLVLCFGVAGAEEGWGGWVAGAFTVLAVLAAGGAIAAGLVARRQIRRSAEPGRLRFTGRGTAVAGISCGAAGGGIALLALALGLVLQW